MKKVVAIRDIDRIEKELKNNKLGVVAFSDLNEKVNQIVSPFVYADKNVYFFLEEKDESSDKIMFDKNVSFTVFKKDEQKKQNGENLANMKYIQIKCSGPIKKVDDQKVIEDVQNSHVNKYSIANQNEKFSSGDHLFIIDTDEIQAIEILE